LTGPRSYVLVVGDPGPDRDWIESTLLQSGLVVAVASEAGLEAAHDLSRPGLVVQDDSPGSSPRSELLARLTSHPKLQGVPVVVASYDADVESYTSTIRTAAAYVIKPAEPDELVGVAKRLLSWTLSTEQTEKRSGLRRPLIMKIEVRLRAQKRNVPGLLLDVAGGGCRVELHEPVARGELVRVVLHTRDASTHVALGAEVRWCKAAPGGVHVAGLRFTGTTALMAGQLLGFVVSEGI
jgi:response regulator RpfG family c-di-GMP phosphodiesterase